MWWPVSERKRTHHWTGQQLRSCGAVVHFRFLRLLLEGETAVAVAVNCCSLSYCLTDLLVGVWKLCGRRLGATKAPLMLLMLMHWQHLVLQLMLLCNASSSGRPSLIVAVDYVVVDDLCLSAARTLLLTC